MVQNSGNSDGFSRSEVTRSDWFKSLSQYEKPDTRKAVRELVTTLPLYFALWGVMLFLVSRGVLYPFLLPLIALGGLLLVRIFIFFHDCAHGAFFPSHKANRALGYFTGVITWTSFAAWQHAHSIHHGTAGDLDRRGVGDVWTMTVEEYQAAPRHTRFFYYLVRSPWFLFSVGAPFMFLILNRFPHKKSGKRETRSVIFTNLSLLTCMVIANFTIGLKTYLMLQLPIVATAAIIGVWLFYVQHQFEDMHWERHDDWDPIRAALIGSSYLKLPALFMWFTGNIGLHHIHHLRPRIPSYNLQRCYDDIPALQQAKPLTFWDSVKAFRLNLWDETRQEMVSFRAARIRS